MLLVVRKKNRERERQLQMDKKEKGTKYGQKSYTVFFVFLYWKHCSNFFPLDYIPDNITYNFMII